MARPELGERIREVRRTLRLTQAEFGKLLGVTKLSVIRYEARGVNRFDVLRKIARLGGVTLGWLLEGEESTMPQGSRAIRDMPLPGSLRESLTEVQSELFTNELAQLRPADRTRYEERAKDILNRARRELQEYRSLLIARVTARRKRWRSRSSPQG